MGKLIFDGDFKRPNLNLIPEGYTLSDMKKGGKWEQDQNLKQEDALKNVEEITNGQMVEELVRGLSNPKNFEN